MDVHQKLDEIIAFVEGARAMPMSSSCVVNRGELLAALDQMRAMLPEQLHEAQRVLVDRESVLDEGRREAQRVVEEARAERSRLLATHPSAQEAYEEAERIRGQARAEADAMRAEVDEYVDAKLANFEVVLSRTVTAVQRGREKLRGRQPVAEQPDGGEEYDTGEYAAYPDIEDREGAGQPASTYEEAAAHPEPPTDTGYPATQYPGPGYSPGYGTGAYPAQSEDYEDTSGLDGSDQYPRYPDTSAYPGYPGYEGR